MTSNDATPLLTVGLIAGDLRERAERSLRHILDQTALDQMEVIVVDLREAGGDFAGADHPRVRYLHRPQYRYFCQAQAEIVREARAPLVASIEDHSYAEPQWAAAILETMTHSNVTAANYTFTSLRPTYLARAILMAEYGHWMVPHPGGKVRIASSTNIAYRRQVLLDQLADDESIFESEFLIHRKILQSGGEIHVSPRATVAHESWSTLLAACQANGFVKRLIADRRAKIGNWGMGKRLAWTLAMTLAPGLHLARLTAVLRRRPALWGSLILGLPVVLSIYAYSSWSEAKGYLLGAGGSREEFLNREQAVRRGG
jgi:hypothetical protein